MSNGSIEHFGWAHETDPKDACPHEELAPTGELNNHQTMVACVACGAFVDPIAQIFLRPRTRH